jgi:hypothetical protein
LQDGQAGPIAQDGRKPGVLMVHEPRVEGGHTDFVVRWQAQVSWIGLEFSFELDLNHIFNLNTFKFNTHSNKIQIKSINSNHFYTIISK